MRSSLLIGRIFVDEPASTSSENALGEALLCFDLDASAVRSAMATASQLGYRDFATQAAKNNADFFFRRILLAGRPPDVADKAL